MGKVIEFLLALLLALSVGVPSCTQYAECGMCGAHVSEWWYVQGASGSPIEVCHDCYESVRSQS